MITFYVRRVAGLMVAHAPLWIKRWYAWRRLDRGGW